MTSRTRGNERRGLARTAALACISFALGLLAAEVLVRAFAHFGGELGSELGRRDPLATLRVPHGELGYRQRPNSEQTYGNGARATSNALGFRGPLVSIEKPQGTFRIVLLGGSTTHGFGVDDDETIDAHMRRMLDTLVPDVRFEVVNLALDGYDSYQVFERMRSDGVPLDPDVVIVNSGINDVRNAGIPNLRNPDPRTVLWRGAMERMRAEAERGGPAPWTRIKHVSYLARLAAFLRQQAARRLGAQRQHAAVPGPAALDYFETNLQRTADLVAEVGAALVLSTPPSALTTLYAPSDTSGRSYWIVDASTTQDYRRALAGRMRQLAARLEAAHRPVRYVGAELAPELFLDDCHLTSDGNRALAQVFVDEVMALRFPARLTPPSPDVGEEAEGAGSLRRGPRTHSSSPRP